MEPSPNSPSTEQSSQQSIQTLYSFTPSASPLTNRSSWIAALISAGLLCLFLLGVTLNTRRNMAQVLKERIRLESESQRLHEALAKVEQSKGEVENMRQDAEQARMSALQAAQASGSQSTIDAAHHRELHLRLASTLDGLKKLHEACDELRTVVAENLADASTWGNLGWYQYETGQYADALESSRKSLQLDDKQGYVRLNIGLIYAVQGNWPNAEQEYRDAIAVSKSATLDAGIKDIKDALAANPDASALEALQKALELLQNATPSSH